MDIAIPETRECYDAEIKVIEPMGDWVHEPEGEVEETEDCQNQCACVRDRGSDFVFGFEDST